jgi:hypothetical protein
VRTVDHSTHSEGMSSTSGDPASLGTPEKVEATQRSPLNVEHIGGEVGLLSLKLNI